MPSVRWVSMTSASSRGSGGVEHYLISQRILVWAEGRVVDGQEGQLSGNGVRSVTRGGRHFVTFYALCNIIQTLR